jgi:hypothetical protein
LNKSDHLKIQAAVLNYIDRTTWQNPYAVTLTLKQGISENGAYAALDTIRASENLRHFRNRLNRSLLGKSCVKKRLSVRCFAVYEGTATVQHCFASDPYSHQLSKISHSRSAGTSNLLQLKSSQKS